jgi:signal transduction histidine kinase/DNA-binding response OmpR family regulator
MTPRLLTVQIRHEHDVVGARRRARQIAAALGFDVHEQTRIATGVSELARNAFRYAGGGTVEYLIEGATAPQVFTARVSDHGPGIGNLSLVLSGRYQSTTGMGLGIIGTRRLMDAFDITSGPAGTVVTIKKILPRKTGLLTPKTVQDISARLLSEAPASPIEEAQQQNLELLRTLDELRARQDDLERVNRELEDTNRGVVALYAELEERADHLRRADDLKTRFLSNMTHEFRTPVNSILALANLLEERLLTPPEQKDELYYIKKSAQQLADLVDDLLDIAKVEAGKIDVRPAPFEIANLFGALRGMLKPLLANSSLALVFDDPEDLPPMFSDESKVSQILRNFISNALKYTECGEVRVSARMTPRRDAIEFVVADTGIGIPADDLSRVFDEFVQIENPLQKRVKGTGLGLPLSKRLAELLGGTVGVTSTLGAGSTFTVTIPMAYRAASTTRIGDVDPGRASVLVIEDSDEDLLLYDRALSGSRFQPVPARSIPAAVAALEIIRPAAIVLDLLLHGGDTWEFLTRLKRDERTASIPVIIISTLDDRQKGMALGAGAYAVKPIAKAELLRMLEELAPAPSAPLRVLTIDDEETHRFIIREMLNEPGYQIAEAGSGEQGLALMHELPPDVVLLDLRLTDMSGIDLCDRLRRDPRAARVPIILITSQDLSEDERRRFGADRVVISKAVLTRERLRSAIRAAVSAAAPAPQGTRA